ncbi:hypothetical protein [Paenarthrobacter histidinolovorans]|uniref:hypothetical protein n=1 Tax=Paenarthrobacter histidinolovorans TaxID=43664 RepID=UPI00166F10C3|nr:hypothetical protein [Paenarthrobacter histidinolovorans]GGJ21470.1 hypothetical protein GCM10010052_18360 [Paenarthrobacter histidinolovorans]
MNTGDQEGSNEPTGSEDEPERGPTSAGNGDQWNQATSTPPMFKMPNPFAGVKVEDNSSVLGPVPDQTTLAGPTRLIDMAKANFSFVDEFLETQKEIFPPNWPLHVDLDLAASILNAEGLPLAWVPRKKIVTSLLHAADREARLQILIENRDEVLDDCCEALDHITHPYLQRQLPLGRRVLAALKSGFDEPAQALAVVVTDAAVSAVIGGYRELDGGYKAYEKIVHLDFDQIQVPYELVRAKAALAPLGTFYATWLPDQGGSKPIELSRHVSVHAAGTDHFTPANALVAATLMASVLRALQDLAEDSGEQNKTAR